MTFPTTPQTLQEDLANRIDNGIALFKNSPSDASPCPLACGKLLPDLAQAVVLTMQTVQETQMMVKSHDDSIKDIQTNVATMAGAKIESVKLEESIIGWGKSILKKPAIQRAIAGLLVVGATTLTTRCTILQQATATAVTTLATTRQAGVADTNAVLRSSENRDAIVALIRECIESSGGVKP